MICKCNLNFLGGKNMVFKAICCKRTSDNAHFASCGGDRDVFFWDVLTGQVVRRFKGHSTVGKKKISFAVLLIEFCDLENLCFENGRSK
jgi:WD40 repeat protein